MRLDGDLSQEPHEKVDCDGASSENARSPNDQSRARQEAGRNASPVERRPLIR